MRKSILLLLSLAFIATYSFGSDNCESLRVVKDKAYGFRPQDLSGEQQKAKAPELDKFWNAVKGQKAQGETCLRQMLSAEKEDRFFLFDGASLLAQIDHSKPAAEDAAAAMSKADLDGIDGAMYVDFLLELSNRGANIVQGAANYLHAKKVEAFVPQHSMTVDRTTGALFLFSRIPPNEADVILLPALDDGTEDVRCASTMAFAAEMTSISFSKLSARKDRLPACAREFTQSVLRGDVPLPARKSFHTREQVLEVLRRMPTNREEGWKAIQKENANTERPNYETSDPSYELSGHSRFIEDAMLTLNPEDLDTVRNARGVAMRNLSDENLGDYYDYCKIMLGVIKRNHMFWRGP
jgi:hypothetical protein